MSIDKSGQWWVGTSPQEIKEYLEAYSAEGYRSQQFRQAKCACGGTPLNLLQMMTKAVRNEYAHRVE
jgi:hypothetical protein